MMVLLPPATMCGANCVCAGQLIDCLGVPGGTAVIGSACDDGNATTGNDVYGANCVCAGQPIDCLGVPGGTAVIGSACDDGNPNSTNDVYGANCVCAGTLANDCEGVPGGPAQPGTACNDNNPNTGNDVYGANCVCAGQLIDCLGVPGGTAVIGSACDDLNANTGNDVYGANCVCAGQLIDCLGVPGGTAVVGSACDDGNPNSSNDVYGANCVCAGTLANDCLGVPGGPAQPGTACDDGNANTGNDVYSANCVCAGQLIDCLGVPGGTAVIGSACDDGNANTGNDVYGANCVCAGQLIDCLGVPGGTAVIGSACNDGNANTGNDVYGANCVCAGQLIDCLGVPGGTAVIGSTCDDGNANTTNDVYGANCVCAGTGLPIDCLGVPGGTAVIGSACDDGNANTIGDVYGANCVCAGINPNCTEDLVLTITLDAFGSQTTWEVRDQTTNTVVANGGPYTDGTPGAVLENICVAAGCYQLTVTDADGISGGGYVLTDDLGRRIIDANGDFTGSSSVVVQGEGDFCVPITGTFVKPNWCDRTDLVSSSFIYCQGVAGATGYQFWFFNPHGTYSRRILKPTTACRLDFAQLPIPLNTALNVRVRALVGGNYAPFGKACRLEVVGGGAFRDLDASELDAPVLNMYPNPNREEVLYLSIEGLSDENLTANVEIFDAMGKRVSAEQVSVADGTMNHIVNLDADMHAGMYFVHVSVDGQVFTERLMRQ
ncbi:MAG: T9SS type A sorting domain-containing protein [Flavobacteriales bacterium]|nr:T9SS type A sorting domain-containing protein [Flavobacteriales bacterium]